ncbi:MAG: hypothetical protein LCH86_14430 [Proteobacteria bacterium]|nr:hypothetical protein [Pseudomonadota bacterium]
MKLRTILLLLTAAVLAGCVSAEEQRARDEAKCRSYGFSQRNDAFAECLQRIDLDRRAEFRDRQTAFDDWNRPVVIYRPVVVPPKP